MEDIMSSNDLQTIVNHLFVAAAVIAVLVAGPFLWSGLSHPADAPQRSVQSQAGIGLPTP
jgi:hypothetical protein